MREIFSKWPCARLDIGNDMNRCHNSRNFPVHFSWKYLFYFCPDILISLLSSQKLFSLRVVANLYNWETEGFYSSLVDILINSLIGAFYIFLKKYFL